MKKMITRSVAAACTVAMSMAFSSNAWADTEPNNIISEANTLALNATVNGTLNLAGGDANDWYVITLPNAGNVTATATYATGLSGFLYFHREDGTQINFSASGTGAKTLTANCIGSNLIYLRCNTNSGAGSYSLQITLTPASTTTDVEPNNNTAQILNTYQANVPLAGQLGYLNASGMADTDDYFYYVHPNDGDATFSVTADPGLNIWVYLLRKDGTQIGFSTNGSGLRQYTATCMAQDTLIGRINRSSGCGGYTAVFTSSVLPNANDVEPNNTIALIQSTFNQGQNFSGHLGYQTGNGTIDSNDWFYYVHPNDGDATFSVTADDGLNIWVYLYRKNGTQIGFSTNGSGLRTFTAPCQAQDTLIGRINRSSGCGSYTAVFTSSTLPNGNDVEPNNDLSQIKQTFTNGQSFSGHLGYTNGNGTTDNNDWFYYVHPTNGSAKFSVTADAELNIWVYLYRKNGTQLGFSTNGSGLREFTADCEAQDTLVGRIFSSSGCGSYTASFSSVSPTYTNDVEPNNSFDEATFTRITKYNEGQLGHTSFGGGLDQSDYYAIKITEAPFALSMPVTYTGTLAGWVYLYNAGGTQLKIQTITPGTTSFDHNITSTGVYFIRVARSSGCGSYRFGEPCTSGSDLDSDNICDGDDTCLANGGWLKVTSGVTTNCLGDNFADVVQVAVTGKYGQGTFGLVTFPAQDIVALSASGTFDMGLYPAGNYRIGHIGTPSLAVLQGITNVSQLSGCYDLSNLIAINNVQLTPGTISATGTTTVCGDDGIASNITFTVSGAEGPTFRWAVLDQTASTVLANNTTGTFNFDTFGPGTYRVTRAVYSGLNPSTVDPQNLPACIRRSNLINVIVTSCGAPATLMVQPNPTTGPSTVTFNLPAQEASQFAAIRTTLEVYDMSGRLVQSLFSGVAEEGIDYRFDFDGSHLPNGVYLYRLTTSSTVITTKMIVAR